MIWYLGYVDEFLLFVLVDFNFLNIRNSSCLIRCTLDKQLVGYVYKVLKIAIRTK